MTGILKRPVHRESRSDDGRGLGSARPPGYISKHTRIGADPGDAEERRATEPRAARLGRAPQDHRGVQPLRDTATRGPDGKKRTRGG